jgi:hypothetical protein
MPDLTTMPTTRRERIDYAAIAEETGLRAGRVCMTPFGWGVQNIRGVAGPHVALFDPPAPRVGEVLLGIQDGCWCFGNASAAPLPSGPSPGPVPAAPRAAGPIHHPPSTIHHPPSRPPAAPIHHRGPRPLP